MNERLHRYSRTPFQADSLAAGAGLRHFPCLGSDLLCSGTWIVCCLFWPSNVSHAQSLKFCWRLICTLYLDALFLHYSASLISSLTPASRTLFLLALPSPFQAVCVVSLAELWGHGFFLILQSKALKFVWPLLGWSQLSTVILTL